MGAAVHSVEKRLPLKKSAILAELLENLKMAEVQAAPPVECDFCSEDKLKAVKSCLVCLASFCEVHVQPHFQPALQKHQLVKATRLQERICSQHGRLLEMFCYNDCTSICLMCYIEDHQGHNCVFTTVAQPEKQVKFLLKMRFEPCGVKM